MSKLKDLRLKKGLTVYEVSKKIGVSISTLYNLESARNTNPKEKVVERICKFYKCSREDIINHSTEKLRKFKCLNQMCPFNKNKLCKNSVFLDGRAPCFGKDRVQDKNKNYYGDTRILFVSNRIRGK